MRLSNLFGVTLHESPAGTEAASHQLLLRAGFIRQLGAGIFSYLPLARKAMHKIENIMREEINAIGGQEITMPIIHPADVWKETRRWYQIGSEMGRFQDKSGHDMVLAMTHEEVVSSLVRSEIRSYRQLPALVYHIQTKWRDDPRPRAGLIRAREFTMLDSYSLDRDWEGLDKQYQAHFATYQRIFVRCGLPVMAVQSDTGMMGGKMAHEFMYLTPIGEDTLAICSSCGYTANQQIAAFRKSFPEKEELKKIERIATSDIKTIDDLAEFLHIPKSKTAKAVFLVATIPSQEATQPSVEKFVFAVIRGDMEVNETKLANALKARELRPATEDEIRSIGAVPGYASPLGLKNALVVVDDLIPACHNLVAGANLEGFHLLNVNYGRDFKTDLVADIADAFEGAECPDCGKPLHLSKGVEVGNIFKLGTRYTDALGCTYLDETGQSKPIIMGSYGIGVGRLLACIAEEHHDEKGLCWPISVAPCPIHLISLSSKNETVNLTAENLYQELTNAGFDVLYDDRVESPGVKFADADLIGLPFRLVVSDRSLKAGGVEFKKRLENESKIIQLSQVTSTIQELIK
jgi:prolyl-tRNA synthetase